MAIVDGFNSFGRLMGRDQEKKKAVCFDDILMELTKDGKDLKEALKLLTESVAINLISYTLKREESKQPPVSSNLNLFEFIVPKRKRGSCGKRDDDVSNRCSFNDSDYNLGEEKEDHQEEKGKKKKKLMRKEDQGKPDLEGVPIPDRFRSKIEELDGGHMKLILAKTLTKTDLESGQGKLSIPINQVRRKFLEPEEETLLGQVGEDGRGRKGIDVVAFIEPSGNVCTNMVLKRWPMKSGGLFALNQGWNGVVLRNEKLQVGAPVQVWAFRTIKTKQLGFALVVLD